MNELISGLITGVIFGFLLQRGQVLRYDKQVGAMRLLDMTIMKFMLSAILVAMIGLYALHAQGLVKFSIKETIIGANVIGGLLYGIGWAVVGYCPGTAVGALAEGRWDALFGIAGMLLGAALFAEAYPQVKATVLTWGSYGKITIPTALGVSPWPVIAVLTVLFLGLFWFFEKKGL
ncbi:MAG: YeeE/YedE family protein [Syntrophaceae bacterium]|nr:YeeE/YedE family protein [Syntrophaceae bacterium]